MSDEMNPTRRALGLGGVSLGVVILSVLAKASSPEPSISVLAAETVLSEDQMADVAGEPADPILKAFENFGGVRGLPKRKLIVQWHQDAADLLDRDMKPDAYAESRSWMEKEIAAEQYLHLFSGAENSRSADATFAPVGHYRDLTGSLADHIWTQAASLRENDAEMPIMTVLSPSSLSLVQVDTEESNQYFRRSSSKLQPWGIVGHLVKKGEADISVCVNQYNSDKSPVMVLARGWFRFEQTDGLTVENEKHSDHEIKHFTTDLNTFVNATLIRKIGVDPRGLRFA